ncbi:hypothetical protein NF27_EY02360 [Candidatus Jidaibacter acanthamoeba]|uniref:Uncharacterized protein n=1 Tax=Candidatus Jidaibacter acanthamoebae TaxID=86105 RepID=A0A0C1QYS1_9RICK|nr:helix-turn-helix transcriptional regulator [Candidatus Jidaibacter acanthamoeba]KIE05140.1 hypothetical protein NF27_EY02360 [Candidatus Jidaibacter acanthamoeba]
MSEIGVIIRKILFFKNLTTADLAKNIGISRKAIDNIIYKNIKKKETVEKISTALGIDLFEYINKKSPTSILNNSELNTQILKKASEIVFQIIEDANIVPSKDDVNTLTAILYKFLLENKEASNEIAKAFCQGMIEYALNNFMVTQKNN